VDEFVNLFIAESHIGNHVDAIPVLSDEYGKTELLSFTFRPSFKKLKDEIECPTTQINIPISNKNTIYHSSLSNYSLKKIMAKNSFDIVDFIIYQVKNDGIVFLGQDADFSGQLMASLLFYHLVDRGIEPYRVLRVPLLEAGYDYINIGFAEDGYYTRNQLNIILNFMRLEQIMMHQFGTKLGFRNMEALRVLYEEKPSVLKRLSKGTSTATYVTKFLLGEEY